MDSYFVDGQEYFVGDKCEALYWGKWTPATIYRQYPSTAGVEVSIVVELGVDLDGQPKRCLTSQLPIYIRHIRRTGDFA